MGEEVGTEKKTASASLLSPRRVETSLVLSQPRLLQSPALTMKEMMMVSKVICVSAFGWLVRVGGGGGRLLADKRAARQEDNEVTMTMPRQYKCTDPSVRAATREQSAVVKS